MNTRLSKIALLISAQLFSTAYAQTVVSGKINREAEITAAADAGDIAGRSQAKPKVKAATTKAQVLPGVGKIPGYKDYFKPVVVHASTTKNEVIDISMNFQNRISTPFAPPKVIDQSNADIQKLGQSFFILPTDSKPITVYVTGNGQNDPMISLTLVPKDIPAQTVLLQIDKTDGNTAQGQGEDERPLSDGYSDSLRFLFRQVALGKVPPGYAEAPLPNATASMRGTIVRPMTRYSGPKADIYAYRVEGGTDTPVELEENSFMQEGVRAVAFFPTSVVRRGEATMAYVLSDKVEK